MSIVFFQIFNSKSKKSPGVFLCIFAKHFKFVNINRSAFVSIIQIVNFFCAKSQITKTKQVLFYSFFVHSLSVFLYYYFIFFSFFSEYLWA